MSQVPGSGRLIGKSVEFASRSKQMSNPRKLDNEVMTWLLRLLITINNIGQHATYSVSFLVTLPKINETSRLNLIQ